MAAAGWFPAGGDMTATQRYWDGAKWTDDVVPLPPSQASPTRKLSGTAFILLLGLAVFVIIAGIAFIQAQQRNDQASRDLERTACISFDIC